MALASNNAAASALLLTVLRHGNGSDLSQGPTIRSNSNGDINSKGKGKGKGKGTIENNNCWREHTPVSPFIRSSNSMNSLAFDAVVEATVKSSAANTREMNSSSKSNHTSITMSSTRSSRSCDNLSTYLDATTTATAVFTARNNTKRQDACSSTQPDFGGLVYSQSSESHDSVMISNWASKYDTEDHDNYDSDSEEEEEALQNLEGTEAREEEKDDRREEECIRDAELFTVPVSSRLDEGTSSCVCGVSELIASDHQTSQRIIYNRQAQEPSIPPLVRVNRLEGTRRDPDKKKWNPPTTIDIPACSEPHDNETNIEEKPAADSMTIQNDVLSKLERVDSMIEKETKLRFEIALLEAEILAKSKAAERITMDATSVLRKVLENNGQLQHHHHQLLVRQENKDTQSFTGTIEPMAQPSEHEMKAEIEEDFRSGDNIDKQVVVAALNKYEEGIVYTEPREPRDDILRFRGFDFVVRDEYEKFETGAEEGDRKLYCNIDNDNDSGDNGSDDSSLSWFINDLHNLDVDIDDDDDDDESSVKWFIDVFHKREESSVDKNPNKTMRMVVSLPLSPASCLRPVVPEIESEAIEVTEKAFMAAELNPLIFELDSLSSRKVEEEIVFHEDDGEEDGMLQKEADENVEHKEEDNDVYNMPRVNDNRDEQLMLNVTNAITAMCLTPPRTHQFLLEHDSDPPRWCDSKESEGRAGDTMTTSCSSTEVPNIEVELHRNSNDEEEDRILVVNAVARALRKSKKSSDRKTKKSLIRRSMKGLKHKQEPKNASIDGGARNSDAMEVLMSLNLMECCTLPHDISIAQSTSTFDSSNSGSIEISKIELTESNALSELTDKNDWNPVEFHDDDKSSHGSRDGIDIVPLHDSTKEEIINRVNESGNNSIAGIEDTVLVSEDFKSCNQIQDGKEGKPKTTPLHKENTWNETNKERRCSQIAIPLRHRHAKNWMPTQKSSSFADVETCGGGTSNCDCATRISADVKEESIVFPPEEMIDLLAVSDSFSIDGFDENLFSDSDPIRDEPNNPMTKSTTPKPSRHKIQQYLQTTTMSSSIEIISSLSSSEDCCIPSPPQQQYPKDDFDSSQGFTLPLYSVAVERDVLPPIHNLPKTSPSISSLLSHSQLTPNKKKKKPKPKPKNSLTTIIHEPDASPSLSDDCSPISSPTQQLRTATATAAAAAAAEGLSNDPLLDRSARQNCTNETYDAADSREKEVTHKTNLSLYYYLDIGIGGKGLAEDSLRTERNFFSLPSPSPSSGKNVDSMIHKNPNEICFDGTPELLFDQENNCSSDAPPEEESRRNCVVGYNKHKHKHKHKQPSPNKGILVRKQHEGAPDSNNTTTTTSTKHKDKDNRSVHWDETQLANKVEKGVMFPQKCRRRPMKTLTELMLRITVVQNIDDIELDQLLGLKHTTTTTRGYIC